MLNKVPIIHKVKNRFEKLKYMIINTKLKNKTKNEQTKRLKQL